MAAIAWLFLSGTLKRMLGVEARERALVEAGLAGVRIESLQGEKVIIRNTGSIELRGFAVFINGELVAEKNITLEPDEVVEITFTPLLENKDYEVKIVSQYGSEDARRISAETATGPTFFKEWEPELSNWGYRVLITIDSAKYSRTDYLISVGVNFTRLFSDAGTSGTMCDNCYRVYESDGMGGMLYEVPSRFVHRAIDYDNQTNAYGRIDWVMNGSTSANEKRYYYILFDKFENGAMDPPLEFNDSRIFFYPETDLDQDGEREMIFGNQYAKVYIIDGQTKATEWESPDYYGSWASLAIADVNNNGIPDLITTPYNGYIYLIEWNGTHYVEIAELNVDGAIDCHQVTACDVDNDGYIEIICGGHGWDRIGILGWDGASLRLETYIDAWDAYGTYKQVDNQIPVSCEDIDGDGSYEIITGSWFLWHSGPNIWSWDGSGYKHEQHIDYYTSGTTGPAIGDVDDDGIIEFMADYHNYPRMYQCDQQGCVRTDIGAYVGPHADAGSILDWDLDGKMEVAYGEYYGRLRVLEISSNGSWVQEWGVPDVGYHSWDAKFGDIDHDGTIELIVGSSDGYVRVFNSTSTTPEWTSSDYGPQIGTHHGDAILIAGEKDPQAFGVGAPKISMGKVEVYPAEPEADPIGPVISDNVPVNGATIVDPSLTPQNYYHYTWSIVTDEPAVCRYSTYEGKEIWDASQQTGDIAPTDWDGQATTWRALIIGDYIKENATKIRIGFWSGTTRTIYCRPSIAQRDGTTSDVIDETWKRLYFSGQDCATASGAEVIWTDWLDYNLDSSKDYFVTVYDVEGSMYYYSGSVAQGYYKYGEDLSLVKDWSAYSPYSNNNLHCVVKIEGDAEIAFDSMMPLSSEYSTTHYHREKLRDEKSYNYHIKCKDARGNVGPGFDLTFKTEWNNKPVSDKKLELIAMIENDELWTLSRNCYDADFGDLGELDSLDSATFNGTQEGTTINSPIIDCDSEYSCSFSWTTIINKGDAVYGYYCYDHEGAISDPVSSTYYLRAIRVDTSLSEGAGYKTIKIDNSLGESRLVGWYHPKSVTLPVGITNWSLHNGTDCLGAIEPRQEYIITVSDDGRLYYTESYGDGSFSYPLYIQDIGYYTRGVEIADFDGDGDYDFVTGEYGDIWYFEKIGHGASFYGKEIFSDVLEGSWIMAVCAADFDNDGDYDFIAAGNSRTDMNYFNNTDGKATFSTFEFQDLPSGNARECDAADFNEDGNVDFVIGACCSGYVYYYEGFGNGSFKDPTQIPGADTYVDDPYGIAAADFDGDMHADMIVSHGSNGNNYFIKGYGNGTFDNTGGIYVIETERWNAADNFDFDHDGNQDVITSNYDRYKTQVHFGYGNGSFEERIDVWHDSSKGRILGIAAPEYDPDIDTNISDYYQLERGTIRYFNDFETGLHGVHNRGGATVERDCTTAYAGSCSLKATATNTNGDIRILGRENLDGLGSWYSDEYPIISFAYKIPSTTEVQFLFHVDSNGTDYDAAGTQHWHGVTINIVSSHHNIGSVPNITADGTWRIAWFNFDELMDLAHGEGNWKIEEFITFMSGQIEVGDQYWFDDIKIYNNESAVWNIHAPPNTISYQTICYS
jgi:hypothetical protein